MWVPLRPLARAPEAPTPATRAPPKSQALQKTKKTFAPCEIPRGLKTHMAVSDLIAAPDLKIVHWAGDRSLLPSGRPRHAKSPAPGTSARPDHSPGVKNAQRWTPAQVGGGNLRQRTQNFTHERPGSPTLPGHQASAIQGAPTLPGRQASAIQGATTLPGHQASAIQGAPSLP